MELLINRSKTAKLALFLPLVFLTSFIVVLTNGVDAQETSGPWGEPQNLSLSAGTSDPVMVVDSSGMAHVIWQDTTLNYVYSNRDDGKWAEATVVELPFGTRRYYPDLTERQQTPLHIPILWSGQDDRVHALWVNEEQRLFYSNVPAEGFADFDEWAAPQELAPSALGVTASVDDAGRLHMAYINPQTTELAPAGLYYRRSLDDGATWSVPEMLYESPYFRSVAASSANVQLAAMGDAVIAAWDNPFEERVYVARSGDSGQSWDPSLEIDQRLREDGAEAIGPNSIRLGIVGEQVHVVWQAGHQGLLCSQFHQLSIDSGKTWQPPERLVSPIEGCPDSSMLLAADEDALLLLALDEVGGHVTAWDGSRWGETQSRAELVRFLNPSNFREVELGCHGLAKNAAGEEGDLDTALVVGCDTGPGGDIWVLQVDLGLLMANLAPGATPIWQRPEIVAESMHSNSLGLLADSDGWLHTLWMQPATDDSSRGSVNYSRWDGNGWSQPSQILGSSDGSTAEQPAFTLGPDDKIMAVWIDDTPGNVYFSQADLSRAGNASEWSSPLLLPMLEAEAVSPTIDVDQDGFIYVAYAVPLNEGRGIYLIQSGDAGEKWLGPVQVFDGAEAGWSMVDKPQLVVADDGTLHIMWTRASSPPNSEPLSIHYARSTDGGVSWTNATEVTQTPGTWSGLLASGDLAVHRLWMADNDDLWHQESMDGGISWGQPQRVSSSGESIASADSLLDGARRPWLFQVAGTRTESGDIGPPVELRNWVFSEGRWSSEEALQLGDSEVREFAAVATGGGDMNVVYAGIVPDISEGEKVQTIVHTSRSLDLPQVQPTTMPTLTPTPVPVATRTPTPVPMPTATTEFPTVAGQGDGLQLPIDPGNPLTGPVLGIIPAAAVVLVAFFIGVRLLRGDRRR